LFPCWLRRGRRIANINRLDYDDPAGQRYGIGNHKHGDGGRFDSIYRGSIGRNEPRVCLVREWHVGRQFNCWDDFDQWHGVNGNLRRAEQCS
jgi:hypothetical protein